MFKLDLHTHSIASPDGSLSLADYQRMLERRGLDYVAVTDHNSIDFALELKHQLSDRIIIGEEIMTRDGEIVGLYLQEAIPAGLGAAEAIRRIHAQGGLVYAPHPFATNPKGLSVTVLDALADQIDVIETHNGRAIFQDKNAKVRAWAEAHHKPMAASSDAHGRGGWGRAYTIIKSVPTRENLVEQLAKATYQMGFAGTRGVLYPKANRMRKRFHRA